MNKAKDVVKDTFSKNNSARDEELHKSLKTENETSRTRIQKLEKKLDELIDIEEGRSKIGMVEMKDAVDTKRPFGYSSEMMVRGNETPIQRLVVFGILKVKLIKWTLLVVDIPELNIDLRRVD